MLGVVVLAALPRLLALDLAGFDHNQEELLKLVDPIVDDGRWPLVGWEISGRFAGSLPALLFWILAIPRFVTLSPAALIGFGAAFDVAAAGLTCVLGRRLFGRAAGLAAGVLYASEAHLVEHSRILWNVTMLPCFTALMLLGVVMWIVDRRPWGLVPLVVGLTCLTQLHLLTVYLVPPLLLVMVLLRPPLAVKPLALALGLGLALYAPYLLNEVREDYPNLRAARSIAGAVFAERSGEEDGAQVAVDRAVNRAILEKAVVFHRFRYAVDQLPPEARLTAPAAGYQAWNRGRSVAFCVGLAVLVVALGRGLAGRMRGRRPLAREARVALVLIAFHYLPLAVLALASFRLYERYVVPIFPVPFLIAVAPIGALVAWSPAERRPRAIRGLGLAASVLVVAGLTGAHLRLTLFTRALSRNLGVLSEAATLGTQTEIARFFLRRGLDHAAFRRQVHYFQWPGEELAERGVGYGPIFRWLAEERGEGAEPGSAASEDEQWMVFYAFEGRHLVPDVDAVEVVEGEHFIAARIDAARVDNWLRSTTRPGDPWWDPAQPVDGWIRNRLPYTTERGTYDEPSGVPELYLSLDATVDHASPGGYLLYKTRACVQGMALDDAFIAGAPCPQGDAKEELPTVLRSIDVTGALTPGRHVLRTKLIPRYVSTWFDAFLLPMRRPGVPLEPPFRELLYGTFLYPELYRYRVPEPAPLPSGRPAGRWPTTQADLAGSLLSGADTRVDVTLERDETGPILHLRYDFDGYDSWITLLFGTEPHVDLSGAEAVSFSLRTNGRGGAARLALKELDGDEW
ncbi:MAG: hypothetical protein KDG89_10700, partial [Geminicoccaceae bacterium]|nr:hypothetical protein [Geminicoccaceae bacterium]